MNILPQIVVTATPWSSTWFSCWQNLNDSYAKGNSYIVILKLIYRVLICIVAMVIKITMANNKNMDFDTMFMVLFTNKENMIFDILIRNSIFVGAVLIPNEGPPDCI